MPVDDPQLNAPSTLKFIPKSQSRQPPPLGPIDPETDQPQPVGLVPLAIGTSWRLMQAPAGCASTIAVAAIASRRSGDRRSIGAMLPVPRDSIPCRFLIGSLGAGSGCRSTDRLD